MEQKEHSLSFPETFIHEIEGLIYEGTKTNNPKPKYIINIKDKQGQKIGFFSFLLTEKTKNLKMAGLLIEPKHRKQGLSHKILKGMDEIAGLYEYNFNTTTPQRKPLTCSILIKNGFKPAYGFSENKKVFTGRTKNGETGIFFEDQKQKDHFLLSKINLSQKTTVVETMEEISNTIEIALKSPYIKS